MRRKTDKVLWLLALSGIVVNLLLFYQSVKVAARFQAVFDRQDSEARCEKMGYVLPDSFLKGVRQ